MIFKALLVSLTSGLTLPILEILMYKYYESNFSIIFFIQSFFNITCIVGYYYIYKNIEISVSNTIQTVIINFSIFYTIQLIITSNNNLTITLIPAIFSTYSILIIQILRKYNVKNLLLYLFLIILVQCTNLLVITSMMGIQNNALPTLLYILIPGFDYLMIVTFIKLVHIARRS